MQPCQHFEQSSVGSWRRARSTHLAKVRSQLAEPEKLGHVRKHVDGLERLSGAAGLAGLELGEQPLSALLGSPVELPPSRRIEDVVECASGASLGDGFGTAPRFGRPPAGPFFGMGAATVRRYEKPQRCASSATRVRTASQHPEQPGSAHELAQLSTERARHASPRFAPSDAPHVLALDLLAFLVVEGSSPAR